MGKLSEKKVLKKLGISDFRHLTKAKVIDLASMLDKMDPEVAKKALEQFPNFAATTKEILVEYKDLLDKGMAANQESVKAYYYVCNSIIESLRKQLESDDLSFDERKYIIEQMKEVADRMDTKDSENKRFILAQWAMGAAAALGSVALLVTALGGKTRIEDNSDNDEEEYDDDSE